MGFYWYWLLGVVVMIYKTKVYGLFNKAQVCRAKRPGGYIEFVIVHQKPIRLAPLTGENYREARKPGVVKETVRQPRELN